MQMEAWLVEYLGHYVLAGLNQDSSLGKPGIKSQLQLTKDQHWGLSETFCFIETIDHLLQLRN